MDRTITSGRRESQKRSCREPFHQRGRVLILGLVLLVASFAHPGAQQVGLVPSHEPLKLENDVEAQEGQAGVEPARLVGRRARAKAHASVGFSQPLQSRRLQPAGPSGSRAVSETPSLASRLVILSPPAQPATPSSPRPGKGTQLLSLRLVPPEVTLRAGASQRFLVLGQGADGLERDLTSESRFSVSLSEVADIDENGRLKARADGELILTATLADQSARAKVRVESSQERRPFSFARDIEGIFTKRGCNDSSCHGGVKGRGGFKLSLNALYPKADYRWISKGGVYQVLSAESGGPEEPRINLEEPEKSLLLQKATVSVPHGGGQRLEVNSPDYETILDWIRRSAPYEQESIAESVRIDRLEVYPRSAVLDLEGTQQLLVTAHLSNGQQEDLTDQVLYVSSNPEVVEVGAGGRVRAVRQGETSILIRAAGHAISAGFGVIAKPLTDYPGVSRRNLIDEHVFAKLRNFSILSSQLSSDEEFLRRVCLDVAGALPPSQRTREFLADRDPRKRDRLIEVLLNSPQYVDYWTLLFGNVLRVSFNTTSDENRTQEYWDWARRSLAENKPYDQMARERLAAKGYGGPTVHYFRLSGEILPAHEIMAEQIRVFFGRRLDCAQCHNHPFEKWSQNQYWGLAAFYGPMTRIRGPYELVIDDPAGHLEHDDPRVMHPRTGEEVEPRYLDGQSPQSGRAALRERFAQWITAHPHFAEAIVNRIWAHFFGRGIVDPVDDFRETNPPSHPDLLRALARDFQEHGYDLKHLMRLILRSRTYQLSSIPNETNKEDRINYSHALPRPLTPEVLLDAISRVTGVEEHFEVHDFAGGGTAPSGTRAIQLMGPELYPSHFLDTFGRRNRLVLPEGGLQPNLAQGLHMWAGSTYNAKISQPGGRVDRLLQARASYEEIIDELYLAAFCRFPTVQKRTRLEERMQEASSRREALEALVWALISSREFAYNH